ncbi:proepiregulin isoform X1 [Neopelma chrysocephalum]|uniref:proepiregulin isoform X1 n=1 Tax=Neopelma chrysocephalum TaxID=114329 RepID=UPI000FCCEEDB|nr:proepiregulin isoform X1 [Neopelma chrysocephalum]
MDAGCLRARSLLLFLGQECKQNTALLGRLSVAGVMPGWKRFPAEWLEPVTEVTATSGYLLQAALGTTVIPLCGPGEMENCTTALIQTENSPRVAQVGITRCKPEMKDYCFHGQCVYIVDLDEHYCRCDVGFSGVRCVHSELVRQPLSKEYVALTVIVVLLFVAAISLASYYIYRRYRNKRRQTNASEYKEVGAL